MVNDCPNTLVTPLRTRTATGCRTRPQPPAASYPTGNPRLPGRHLKRGHDHPPYAERTSEPGAKSGRVRSTKGSNLVRTSISRFLAVLVFVPALLVGLVVCTSPANAAVVSTLTLQNDIMKLTNYQRAKVGCKPLRADAHLMLAARVHSAWMAQTGKFSHIGRGGSTFDARIRTAGYANPRSENIAWGFRTGTAVVTAWMRSPEHRANLLDCTAKAVAVGAIYSANGTPYYTQDFGTR